MAKIVVLVIVVAAVLVLVRKVTRKASGQGCGNCGCHKPDTEEKHEN